MDLKIKTELYAKQLRIKRWRLDLARWIQENGGQRVLDAKPMKNPHWSDRAGFSTDDFFRGSPQPPDYPDDKVICEIQALLRQLGITGQETVTVSTEDVARLLEGSPLRNR